MKDSTNQPCGGSLSLTEDHLIADADEALLAWLGYDREGLCGCHFESILTRSSGVLYQLFFLPLMKLNGRAEQMYLSLRKASGAEVPVVLDAWRREDAAGKTVYACVMTETQR